MVLTRRALVCGCCAAAGSIVLPRPALATGRRFCADNSSAIAPANYQDLRAFYGSSGIGRFLEGQFRQLEGFFRVRGDFFVDHNASVAYMTGYLAPINGKNGTVAIGARWLRAKEDVQYGAIQVIAVMAHELAHLFQVANRYDQIMLDAGGHRVKYVELHADFMAGEAMAWRARTANDAPDKIANQFFHFGDRNLRSPDHHGDERERYHAFATGYGSHFQATNPARPDPHLVAARGLQYVRNNYF